MTGPIVLFDGVCNLCAGSVLFILEHEAGDRLRFASLQSEAAARLLAERGLPPIVGDPDSVVVVDGDRVLTHSTGALFVARHLRWPWRALGYLGTAVPRPLRDVAYRFVARNRYRWMGKKEECWVPRPHLRARFLDQPQQPAAA